MIPDQATQGAESGSTADSASAPGAADVAPESPTASSVSRPDVRPVDLRDYAKFDRDEAQRVRVLATDVLTLDLWCLEPWQETDLLRYHEVDVAYTVLAGTAWFETEDGDVGLGPLGAILVPAPVAHEIHNRTADPVIVLASGSPPDVPADDVATDPPVEAVEGVVHRPGQRRRLRSAVRRLLGG